MRKRPFFALILFAASAASPAHAALAPRLNQALRTARMVAAGNVHDVRRLDDGQLLAAGISVTQTFKGTQTSEVSVVQMRQSGVRAPLFEDKSTVVAFLVPASAGSYLRTHLGPGVHWQPADPNLGVLSAPQAGDAELLVRLATQLVELNRRPPNREAKRSFIIDLWRSRAPVLLEDAAESLAEIDDLATTLAPPEEQVLEAALVRSDTPPPVQAALIRAVGNARLAKLLPFLQGIRATDPMVEAALWDATAALGAPMPKKSLEEKLATGDAETRKNVMKEKLARGGDAAIDEVGRIAKSDRDESVRVAGAEMLGETKSPKALAPLEGIYADDTWTVRQAATRAIMAIGGQEARQSFERLAFTQGPEDAQRFAVVALFLSGVTRDDPIMKHIMTDHPSESVRDLAEHGIEWKEH